MPVPTDATTEDTTDVDTSTDEETQDTEAEALENDDTSFEDAEGDETEESEESEEDDRESTDDTEEESEEDEGNQSQDEEAKGKDTNPEAERKRHNDEMAQKRIAEREERQRVKAEQQNSFLQGAQEAYDLAIQNGMSHEQAQIEANRETALRQLQVDAYNNRIESNTNKLDNGIDRAVANIDLFRTGSPEVKAELAASLDDFERMYVRRDANGDPVVVEGDVYQFLQTKAESIKRLTGVGARNETRAKNNAKSRTETLPTRRPKEAKKDPDLEGFDEEADRW